MEHNPTPYLIDEQLYSERDAAGVLGISKFTLRNSRNTGVLLGVSAPPFVKMGTSVRYKGDTLREWREQFPEQLPLPGMD